VAIAAWCWIGGNPLSFDKGGLASSFLPGGGLRRYRDSVGKEGKKIVRRAEAEDMAKARRGFLFLEGGCAL